MGFVIAASLVQRWNKANYPLPRPHTPFVSICFDSEHSDLGLPAAHFPVDAETSYETFYVWTQRLGHFPSAKYSLREALDSADAVVVVNPSVQFSKQQVQSIVQYVRHGGKVLVLDDPRNISTSTAYQILSPFGLRIRFDDLGHQKVYSNSRTQICEGDHVGSVVGGTPVLHTGDGLPLLSSTQSQENGIVAVGALSALFTDENMGPVSTIPDERQSEIYELEFWLFRDLLELGSSDRYVP